MAKAKKAAAKVKFKRFEASDFLKSEAAIEEFLAAAMEDPNPDVFLAALLIGDPDLPLDRTNFERAALNRDVLLPILEEGRVRRLRELTAMFRSSGTRVNLREWWRAAETTACRTSRSART